MHSKRKMAIVVIVAIILITLLFIFLPKNNHQKDIIDRMKFGLTHEEVLKLENIPESALSGWIIKTQADNLFHIKTTRSDITYDFNLDGNLNTLKIECVFKDDLLPEKEKLEKYFFDKYGSPEKSQYGFYTWEFKDKTISMSYAYDDVIFINCYYNNPNW